MAWRNADAGVQQVSNKRAVGERSALASTPKRRTLSALSLYQKRSAEVSCVRKNRAVTTARFFRL